MGNCRGSPKAETRYLPGKFAGAEVARERTSGEVWGLPRLLSRNHANLEAGDDAVGNGLVDAELGGGGWFLHGRLPPCGCLCSGGGM